MSLKLEAIVMLRLAYVVLICVLCPAMACAADIACKEPYPPSMVAAFPEHCSADTKTVCKCVIEAVQKTIPLSEFIEASYKAGGLNADPRFNSATKECIAKGPPVNTGSEHVLKAPEVKPSSAAVSSPVPAVAPAAPTVPPVKTAP